jgi:hypothetical protein
MNPVDWLKALYGWIGVGHPKASLCGAIILGAFLGGVVWRFAAHTYNHKADSVPTAPPATTVNSTTGSQSPILTDNRGNVTITNEQPATSKPPAKDDKSK